MKNPLISVVVPTKNRYKYLKHLISLVESFKDERIELLIHDNSDDNSEILEFLSPKKLISTNYLYDSDKLSMGENAERGINKCAGEYVCFIGDDDAVCRNIADCAEWMRANDVDVVRPLYLQYVWNEDAGENMGWVYYDPIKPSYKICNPIKELKKVLNNGVPHFGEMAKIYHGVVKKSVLEAVQHDCGTLFPGPTPDMSGAVSIAFYTKKYAMINVPVVIPGMSRMVGGGVMGKVLTLDEVQFITDRDRNNWEEDFPKLWATELIWPDCAMKALRSTNHLEFEKELNKYKMLSRLVAVHHTYFKDAYQFAHNKIVFLATFVCYFIVEGCKFFVEKNILPKLNGKLNGRYIVKKGFGTIVDAESYLMNEIKKNDFKTI